MAGWLGRDKDERPPVLSPREYIEESKGRQIVAGRSLADIEESTAQLVSAMTTRGAEVEEAPPATITRPSGESTAMTPVGTEESKLAELKAQFKLDELRRLHGEELAKGGAIRRDPYQSTGVGQIIGGTIGAVATGLTPAGPVPGAIAGAVAGEAAEQALTSGSITPEESLRGMGEAAGAAGLAEVGGLAFRTLRPVHYIEPRLLTPEQINRKALFEKYKIPYLPHEITDSGFHKFMADIGESGVLNKNAYDKMRADQNALRKEAINGIADQVGTHIPPDQLAQSVVNVVHDSREAMSNGIDVLYNTIREDLKYTKTTQQVPTGRMIPNKSGLTGPGTEVPELVTQERLDGGRWADISQTKAAFQEAKSSYEDAAKHLNQPDMLKAPWYQTVTRADALPDQAQWNDAHLFLKEVRAEMRRVQEAKAAGSDTATMADLGVLKKIEVKLEGDLEQALKTSSDPKHQTALRTWIDAQQNVKEMSETYRNETVLAFVRKVDKHGGEPAMKEFVASLSPEDTAKVMNATAEAPDVQKTLQRYFIQTGLDRAGGLPGDELVFDPKKARNFLFGKDEFTARKTEMMIPYQQRKDISEFLDATQKQIEAQKSGKAGSVFMAMAQSGAVFAIPYGTVQLAQGDTVEAATELAGGVSVLVTPTVIARLLQNPRTANLLIQGMRYSYTHNTYGFGKVTQQLVRLDEGFARAVQTAAHASGFVHQATEDATAGAYMQPSTAFPLEK